MTPVDSPPDMRGPETVFLLGVDHGVVAEQLVQVAVLGLGVPVGLDHDGRRAAGRGEVDRADGEVAAASVAASDRAGASRR